MATHKQGPEFAEIRLVFGHEILAVLRHNAEGL
jgi:hypothetical protein